jgi:hypothetical protein
MINFLNKRKNYKAETFHCAVTILDRYLKTLSAGTLLNESTNNVALATVSVLIAAKLE